MLAWFANPSGAGNVSSNNLIVPFFEIVRHRIGSLTLGHFEILVDRRLRITVFQGRVQISFRRRKMLSRCKMTSPQSCRTDLLHI